MDISQSTDGNDVLHGTSDNDDLDGGAGNDTLYGYAGNDYLNGNAGTDAMYGGAGDDYYIVDEAGDQVVENDAEGTDYIWTFRDLWLVSYVENLYYSGSSNFYGTGNELDNHIRGGAGNDTLDGGLGADRLQGLGGNDFYILDDAGDQVVEVADAGTDKVYVYFTEYELGQDVEQLAYWGSASLSFTGTGNALDNTILGGGGDDFLYGLTGSDFLIGSGGNDLIDGGAGADQMAGGGGDDTYRLEDGADLIQEDAGEGTDTVESTLSLTLGANVENLVLVEGSAALDGTGNGLANSLNGNSAANRLEGGGGNDLLDGGAGADIMIGGSGDDGYHVDEISDEVHEDDGEGIDTVHVALSEFSLGQHMEHLVYAGPSAADFTGTGNALDNDIQSGGGNDILDGGTGADTLAGMDGDDLYYVDDSGDKALEDASQGTDTVIASVAAYALGDHFENLTLASGALDGDGNAQDNVILGNEADNRLDGGAGADRLDGGDGNDVYVVDDGGDVVVEASFWGGEDLVFSSVSFALGTYVDNLTLTGSGDIDATGNSFDNVLIGNSGANVLDGGHGTDTMTGGAGDDSYHVNSGIDTVVEVDDEGSDTVHSAISHYTLGNGVERLVYSGLATSPFTGTGNGLGNEITGGSGNDLLSGEAGDDLLVGNAGDDRLKGGTGADRMEGGAGDDSYDVDGSSDVVLEADDEGRDTVNSLVSFALGEHLENLVLLGSDATDGTGNLLDNRMTGNGSANRLVGGEGNDVLMGGAGGDSMTGGAGDDSYDVDDAGDKVVETASEGTDTVLVSLNSYALSEDVERLIYNGASNAGFTGTGNALDNRIHGGTDNDDLDGGLGADILFGGSGDDAYRVDDAGDYVAENEGEGTDTVHVALGQYLLGEGVERLIYAGPSASAFMGFGNSLDNHIEGGDARDVLEGGLGTDKLVGHHGDDSYYVDDAGDDVVEAADEGTDIVFTALGAFTLAANVENVVHSSPSVVDFTGTGNSLDNSIESGDGNDVLDGGDGADMLSSGAGDDQIRGGAGEDQINGGAGADRMEGGAGDDYYHFVGATDVVAEQAGEGTDWVYASESNYALTANVENLLYAGPAASSFTGTGNDLANLIVGGSGNDALDGGLGFDMLIGGLGDDIYRADGGGDFIVEMAGEGTDTVHASGGFHALAENVERLRYSGTPGASFTGIGNGLDNEIVGGAGSDSLAGGGGADRMVGGAGDDFYNVSEAGDRIVETIGEGRDGVLSTIGYSLAGQHVENLFLFGSDAINGTGNGFDNLLIGNEGANKLRGGGGNDELNGLAGADALHGEAGDDRYSVDDAGDVVFEKLGNGHDSVDSAESFSIAGQYIEDLTLTGALAINGTGNGLDNVLTGNGAANRLRGGGGNDVLDGAAGADTLHGETGDDHYKVADAGDLVLEKLNEGHDSVESSASYSLAGQYVEDLELTGTLSINGTGNGLDNLLAGNSGSNLLRGFGGNDALHGGLGSDTLQGGAGEDGFFFDTAPAAGNVDAILDFSVRDDTIFIDDAVFGAIAQGQLDAGAFAIGTAAVDASDRILYDKTSGNIFYDADGTGAGAAVLFASVAAGTVLTNADFIGF